MTELMQHVYRAKLIVDLDMAFPEVGRLLNHTGYYLDERAQYVEAERLYQQALTIRKQALGIYHPDVATSGNNLAELIQ